MIPAWHFCLRPIPGYDGYFASIDGHVWSMRKGGPAHWPPRREPLRLAGAIRKKGKRAGKRAVTLCLGSRNRNKTEEVPHLVWQAFRGERPDGSSIWHYDGDLTNDSLDNLRCDTPAEISAELQSLGRIPYAMPLECRFSQSELRLIATSRKASRKLAATLGTYAAPVVAARATLFGGPLASYEERAAVMRHAAPLLPRDHHIELLRWLVGRMQAGGIVRIDRRDDLPLCRKPYASAMRLLRDRGIIHPMSRHVYRFTQLVDCVAVSS